MVVASLRASLVPAVRDLLAILVVGLVGGSLLAAWCIHVDAAVWTALGVHIQPGLADAVRLAIGWLRMVAPFALALWCAGRGRAGAGARWLPAWAALGAVAVGTALAVAPWPHGLRLVDTWPGPDMPLVPNGDGYWRLGLTPAWGYPVLSALFLAGAAVLGARDGRKGRLDDESGDHASVRAPAPVRMSPLGAALVAVPAAAATAGAVTVVLTLSARFSATSSIEWTAAAGPLWWLTLSLAAAGLASGTGPLGVAGAGAAALPAVVMPVMSWLAGGDDLLLAQAAASLLAGAVLVAWRPGMVWAVGALGPSEPPVPAAADAEPLG